MDISIFKSALGAPEAKAETLTVSTSPALEAKKFIGASATTADALMTVVFDAANAAVASDTARRGSIFAITLLPPYI
jgi:hypothetical protein